MLNALMLSLLRKVDNPSHTFVYNSFMKLILLLSLFTCSSSLFAIEIIIGGKAYYIEKYEIKDNGKTIIIPYTIHLDQKAFQLSLDECRSKKMIAKKRVMKPQKRKISSYGSLIKDLKNGYYNLNKSFTIKKEKSGPSKNHNFK